MIGIRPIAHAAAFQQDGVVETSCIGRTWCAVVDFFTWIAKAIANAINAVWNCLKNVFCLFCPDSTASIPGKSALYENMPQDPVGFVERSIEIFQETLRNKEEMNLAALPAGAPIPDSQRPLKAFNDQWETMMNVVDIANAVVRAYVFSDSNATAAEIPFFNQVVRQTEGQHDDPAVIDPETGRLLHNGGREMIDVREDRTVRLRELRAIFNLLPDREKEVILDKVDFAGFNQLDLSANGRTVLEGIAGISNLLHQNNHLLMEALQAVHRKKFP